MTGDGQVMKILLAHNFYRSSAPSGEDVVYLSERRLLESNGIEIVPFEKHNDDLDDSTFTKRMDVALSAAWSRRSYQEIKALIRRERPDIAHFHNTFPQISPSAYLACQELGVPVVQTLHNFRFICAGALLVREGKPCEDCVGTTLLPALRHRCYRGSLPATAAVVWAIQRNRWKGTYSGMVNRYIALTEFSRAKLIAGGFPEQRIVVKPNFIRMLAYRPSEKQDYAIFVGRLTQEKGIKTLLAAWRHVPERRLLIVGDGELRGELEAYARTHRINANFLGYQPRDKVFEYVSRACIQIVPSESYETFGMVVIEAYACGTPVIASRMGSLAEIVIDGQTGLTFEAGNPIDLIDKINKLWGPASALDRAEMGRKAQQIVRTRFGPERNFDNLLNIYAQALNDFTASRFAHYAGTVRRASF